MEETTLSTVWVVHTAFNETIEAVCATERKAAAYIAEHEGEDELYAEEVTFYG